MPEGHSVHRLARQFADCFVGQSLAVSSPQGRFAEGAAALDGAVLEGARAHGKQLFLDFAGDRVLRSHLGLYGAWSFGGTERFRGASSIGAPRRIGEREAGDDAAAPTGRLRPPAPVGAVRVRLVGDEGWADLRGPTLCVLESLAEAEAALARLGPDPLDPGADPEPFVAAVRSSRRPVGVLLMDQAVLAGVGNIFRAESLFRCGVDPLRPGRSLDERTVRRLWAENVALMRVGARLGRIVTTDPADRPGVDETAARPEHAHYVYRRAGQPCRRCGTPVATGELAGRGLYWCPACQA
ncbi:formamidopyrimidine-DNA glycosylase [Kocuria sp. CNJ-770]|uniref:Fpg/Nei family DNA glycosylase n=1 Tax=Kocuria sp. CNJ-770 TaxID=1904964 RepID=UPI00095ABF4B|nr:DNA-formamidopyrimidine glycosylase family protein [Kocuria sp. CNJ-770]OLT09659.1 formamidopyrimidine-DNA glycosylase [Kocuria sp. CNJ-770]